MTDVTGIFVVMAPVVAVVLYCNIRDHRRQLADELRADIHSAARRVLGGESMLAIQVEPAVSWRLGRVHLSVPGGYEFLVAAVSGTVIQRLPIDYELVVHRASVRASATPAKGASTTAKRILFLVTPTTGSGSVDAVRSAGRIVRETGGTIRLAYIAPLPPARVDEHDRLVADADREMTRITGAALERLAVLASELDGVPVEQVVRFGRLAAELSIEAEVFGADMIALATPARRGLRESVQAWSVERAARAARVPLVVLPPPAEGAGAGSGGSLAVSALR